MAHCFLGIDFFENFWYALSIEVLNPFKGFGAHKKAQRGLK